MNFFRTRQRNAARENIEVTFFDSFQKAAVGADQSPKSCVTVTIDTAHQRRALLIEFPGTIRFEFEQVSNLRSKRPGKL